MEPRYLTCVVVGTEVPSLNLTVVVARLGCVRSSVLVSLRDIP